VAGRGVLDLALRAGSDALAVTMVNLANPMMMKGPTREIYPTGTFVASVAIPEGRTFGSARLLVAGTPADATVSGSRVEIEVPSFDLVEAVHIDWA
jgi:hypothetical protein